ncbi:glycosyltransferase [Gramella lutea]|uniref:Glycosyltransferase n=1 Tax=Christiangramia lutea TaxID=1607951 RepID=A0A9X1V374_9FLAO|nr:glycosyltransferase [Christiangramia lutea]MCH4821978.1 glycosyltransferase [Christiangramia lutea]
MNILFVSSGNSSNGISPITFNQGVSLKKEGSIVEYFLIKGKGVSGYIASIRKLRKHLKNNNYDIVHAHYSLSGMVAALAGAKPLIVSLMGSDVKTKGNSKKGIYLFARFFWDSVIVKSHDMKESLDFKNIPISIIPNGVDFDRFKVYDRKICLEKTKWDNTKSHILFAADPARPEKNFSLAKESYGLLENGSLEMHYLNDISNEEVPFYLNSADVVLLTSLWEGSPNVIKEAMACCRPIVSTDVGDVKDVVGGTTGCFIADFNGKDVALKIEKAFQKNKTSGREDIAYLESSVIAQKLLNLYKAIKN